MGQRLGNEFGVLERELDQDTRAVLAQRVALDNMLLRARWDTNLVWRAMVGEIARVHDERVAFPPPDRMSADALFAVVRMLTTVQVNRALLVPELRPQGNGLRCL